MRHRAKTVGSTFGFTMFNSPVLKLVLLGLVLLGLVLLGLVLLGLVLLGLVLLGLVLLGLVLLGLVLLGLVLLGLIWSGSSFCLKIEISGHNLKVMHFILFELIVMSGMIVIELSTCVELLKSTKVFEIRFNMSS